MKDAVTAPVTMLRRTPMTTKAEQKRAEIIAKQAARELAEAERHATGTDRGGAGGRKTRRKFPVMRPFAGSRGGRPAKT